MTKWYTLAYTTLKETTTNGKAYVHNLNLKKKVILIESSITCISK